MTPTLFQRLLGAPFYQLAPAVRALHGHGGAVRYEGRATVVRGRGLLAWLCARVAGLPPAAGDVPLSVRFDRDGRGETWRRRFGAFAMDSRLRLRDGRLVERLGVVQLVYALHVDAGALYWYVDGVRVLGLLSLPASWCRGVQCREYEVDGRYAFVVDAALPLVGRLVRYEGWLEPA